MDAVGFRLKLFLFLFLSVMLLGTVAFAHVEGLSFLDALYFSIVTVATVGYGDIHPTTTVGKILAIALIITGVGTFLEVIASITQVMLKRRDKEQRAEKLNMILGLFFSEIGTRLLKSLSEGDPDLTSLVGEHPVTEAWGNRKDLDEASRFSQHSFNIDIDRVDLESIRRLLERKGDLLLRLLENPMLLERESFTDLLRAIFHLRDELMNRDEIDSLPAPDKKHLAGDMERIYRQLTSHWLLYMKYLRTSYPYLFHLARRTNPFDRTASAIIRE